MNRRSLDLREKLPANLIEMIRAVSSVPAELGIPFFVIGASARDLILHYGYNIRIKRATKDIDIGVAVGSWDEYEELRKRYLGSGKFIETRIEQRLIWDGENRIILDVVPFGAIESPEGRVAFPPDGVFVMTTHGFREAERDTLEVQLADDLAIRVISLAGLGLLKLVSWSDRRQERERDVLDLWLVMNNYLDAGNEERLFAEDSPYFDLVEDFDIERTGARLFARDVRGLLNEKTRQILQKALSEDQENSGIYQMAAVIVRSANNLEPDDGKIVSLWRVFREELLT